MGAESRHLIQSSERVRCRYGAKSRNFLELESRDVLEKAVVLLSLEVRGHNVSRPARGRAENGFMEN